MLLDHEYEKVQRAKQNLGRDRRSQTEGHLVAKLDFGFWVALNLHRMALRQIGFELLRSQALRDLAREYLVPRPNASG